MLRARVRATTSSTSSNPPHPPNPPVLSILSFHPLSSFTTTPVDAVGGEPGCQWSWTTAWRPHRGPRAGGTLRGQPPQRLARALPCPGPHAPYLRRATERCGWVGKQAAGVTDDAEGIVMGKDLTPLKGERGRLKSRRSGMVCSRVADAA